MRIARLLSVAYLLVLIAVAAALYFVGERWWITLIGLYLPRWPLVVPLIFLVPAALRRGRRRLLLLHAIAAALLLFPLWGLNVPLPGRGPAAGPPLRIMSYNIWYQHRGSEAILREVQAAQADIVLFQANRLEPDPAFARYFRDYHVHTTSEFLLASRLPILQVDVPPDLPAPAPGVPSVPASFVHYVLLTAAGPIDLYNIHPFSPRDGFDALRDEHSEQGIYINTEIRHRQARALSQAAAGSHHPVIIAGDTNLPGLSWIYHQYLGGYQDSFSQVGLGFGYTFPATRLPWMRIDRVLGGPGVRFVRFALGGQAGSDHVPVIADAIVPVVRSGQGPGPLPAPDL